MEPILNIFNSLYEKTNNSSDVVKVSDVINNIKSSEEYANLTEFDKKTYRTRQLYLLFRDDMFIGYFKAIYTKKGRKGCMALTRYKLITN